MAKSFFKGKSNQNQFTCEVELINILLGSQFLLLNLLIIIIIIIIIIILFFFILLFFKFFFRILDRKGRSVGLRVIDG